MDKREYVLLFSDHVWFACYEPNVDEMVTTYKWEHPNTQYVIAIFPSGERRKIDL